MSKARDLADFISTGSILSDGTLETVEINGVTASAEEVNKLDGVTVTTDEINYLAGASSAIQTQIDGKAPISSPTFTGTAVIPTASVTTLNLSGTAITATATELNYVSGATSAIQTQLDAKAPTASPTFTTGITSPQVDITAQGDLRLQDSSGGQYVALQAPATISSNYTLTMPSADGAADQVLKTNGSGVLSFGDAGGGGSYVRLEGGSLSTSTFLDIDLPSDYDVIHIIVDNILPTTARRFEGLLTQNSFSSFITSYSFIQMGIFGASYSDAQAKGNGSYINFFYGRDVIVGTSSDGVTGHIYVVNGKNDSTGAKGASVFHNLAATTTSENEVSAITNGFHYASTTGLVDGIRLRFEGATNAIQRGRYQVYGLTNT